MKRKTTLLLASLLIFSIVLASFSVVSAKNGNDGPSDNSGDGVSDGGEFDSQNGPNGNDNSVYGNDGPAPDSGDGISDGSGW